VPAPTPAPRPAPGAEAPAQGGHRLGLAIGLGAVGAAAAGAGVLFELRARRASDQLTAIDRRGGAYDPAKARAGQRDERIGVALLAAGGVALAAGVAVLVVMDRGARPAGAATVAPLVGTSSAGLLLSTGF
jgi:hypothetical protein